MRRIDHIVVPVDVPASSDLAIAQPITFETMRRARRYAQSAVNVRLLALRFADESVPLPEDFEPVKPLTRTISDLHSFRFRKKLPLLRDILERFYQASDAEYLIYTNVDIALQKHFYTAVNDYIDHGFDAFVINRRTIPDSYTSIAQLEKMHEENGSPHPGYDCFVFRRTLYPEFVIGNVFLGTGHVDLPLISSMIAHAKQFGEFRDEHLTFHIGDKRSWWSWKNRDYIRCNDRFAGAALRELAAKKKWMNCMRPWIRQLIRISLLKNSIIVAEFKRLAQEAST